MTCCLHTVHIPVSPDVSHKPGHVASCFTHFRPYGPFVSPSHHHRRFQLAYCDYFDLLFFGSFYLMASQDLISQFSQDTNVIPASQPDRSRTPHRPQHGWHQTVPTFRGPMHFAMTTPRPFWHPAGIPPPPTTTSFSSRPTWTQPTPTFPPTPPTFSQQPFNHANLTPQRHPLTPDRRDLCHPQEEVLQSTKATPVDLLKSHRLTNGNPTLTSMTPTRSTGWISRPGFAKAGFLATKTLKVWILCKSHSGSFCTKACTIHGSAVLHTDEKLSSFHLTT